MNVRKHCGSRVLLLALIFCFGHAIAQNSEAANSDADTPVAQLTSGTAAAFSQPELEQMLAPIALYPDALLAQMLMAATYPLEVVEAARWSQANPSLQGDDAVRAVATQTWDASVKALVSFPRVLATMSDRLQWTERLGDAFLSQQAQVMDTVQDLRHRARLAGTLSDDEKLAVNDDADGDIEIGSGDTGTIYVPYCDPFVAYGAWPWPQYTPVSWAPWPDYYGYNRCNWGPGIYVQPVVLFGNFAWHRHRLHDRRYPRPPHGQPIVWHHDPIHRHGVAYHATVMDRDREQARLQAAALRAADTALPLILQPGIGMPNVRVAPSRYGTGGVRATAGPQQHAAFSSAPSGGGHVSAPAPAASSSSSNASSGSAGPSHSH